MDKLEIIEIAEKIDTFQIYPTIWRLLYNFLHQTGLKLIQKSHAEKYEHT